MYNNVLDVLLNNSTINLMNKFIICNAYDVINEIMYDIK